MIYLPQLNVVRSVNRGNGAASKEGVQAVNATCDVQWPELKAFLQDTTTAAVPKLFDVIQYDLAASTVFA